MPLDSLEADFFGDLASDTHGVWEIFEFVRLHYPGSDEGEVLRIGTEYLSRWIENRWIEVAARPLHPTKAKSISDVSAFIQEHGVAATVCMEGSPSVDITEAGRLACDRLGLAE